MGRTWPAHYKWVEKGDSKQLRQMSVKINKHFKPFKLFPFVVDFLAKVSFLNLCNYLNKFLPFKVLVFK